MADVKTIEFTDATLVDGIRGEFYRDFVAARTVVNGIPNNQTVNYSISPSLSDLGLSMDDAGVVTGTVSHTATLGTHSYTVTATSPGHFRQRQVHDFKIFASVVPPSSGTMSFTVSFAPDSSVLSALQKSVILRFLGNKALNVSSGSIVGYVRRTSDTANAVTLSIARARVVKRFLIANGVAVPLRASGMGVLNSSASARNASVSLTYSN
jgi:outer membrane protein OmpA-like peptidoglycan-associated protein